MVAAVRAHALCNVAPFAYRSRARSSRVRRANGLHHPKNNNRRIITVHNIIAIDVHLIDYNAARVLHKSACVRS